MPASARALLLAAACLSPVLAAGSAAPASEKARRLARVRLQAEVQSLVAAGEPLRARLHEIVPLYAAAGPEALADLAAERGRINLRLRPIHLRLAVLEKEYEAAARAYELQEGFKVLSQMSRKGAPNPAERVIGDVFALENFGQDHIDFFKRLGALQADDTRAFAAAQAAARSHRQRAAVVSGGFLAGGLLVAALLVARRGVGA